MFCRNSPKFPYEIETLVSTINSKFKFEYSIVGGFVRDLIIDHGRYNDIDICTTHIHELLQTIKQFNIKAVSGRQTFSITIAGKPVVIDFIMKDVDIPDFFDFTINEVAYHSNGMIYGNTQTWLDLDMKLLRVKENQNITLPIIMRACRFVLTRKFTIEEKTLERIRNTSISLNRLSASSALKQIDRIKSEGCLSEVMSLMKTLNIKGIDLSSAENLALQLDNILKDSKEEDFEYN